MEILDEGLLISCLTETRSASLMVERLVVVPFTGGSSTPGDPGAGMSFVHVVSTLLVGAGEALGVAAAACTANTAETDRKATRTKTKEIFIMAIVQCWVL